MDQDRAKMGQDERRLEVDEREMAQDAEDELQDALLNGCLEHLMKNNPVKGPSRVRGGSVQGQLRGSAWRNVRPCSRLRLRRSL